MRSWMAAVTLIGVGCGPSDPPASQTPVPVVATDVSGGEAVRAAMAATVFISSHYRACEKPSTEVNGPDDLTMVASGSGFVVDPGGLVITNRHVVEAWRMITSRSPGSGLPESRSLHHLHQVIVRIDCGTNKVREYIARVLAVRELPDDVALLRIEPEGPLPTLKMVRSETLQMQQQVWALGFPLGGTMEETLQQLKLGKNPYGPDISVREGRVTSLRRDDQGLLKGVEYSCPIDHGNSGGPVVNASGEVVALTTYGIGDKSPFALPTERILHHFGGYLDKLRAARADHGEARVLRVRRGPRPDPKGELEFADPGQAFARARDGDIIEFDEGEFILEDEQRWPPTGVTMRIRGRGMNRTKVSLAKALQIAPPAGHWLELSGMEIADHSPADDTKAAYQGEWVAEVLPGGHAFLSGVRITREASNGPAGEQPPFPHLQPISRYALSMAGASEADVCQSELSGCRITGESGTPRLFSVASSSSIGNLAASPVLTGCEATTFVSDSWRARTQGAAADARCSVVLEGCWFRNPGVPVSLGAASGRLRECRMPGLQALVPAEEHISCDVECVGSLVEAPAMGGGFPGCRLSGRLSAAIRDCLVISNEFPAVEAEQGVTLTVDGNRFVFERLSSRMAVIPQQGETREAAVRRLAATQSPGLHIHRGSHVTYGRNHFESRVGGIAVVLYGDAPDRDGGTNLCTGYDVYKQRRAN